MLENRAMKRLCLIGGLWAVSALAQTATALDAKVQAPELSGPQRGSLVGPLSNVAFGPSDVVRGGFSLAAPFTPPTERGPLLAQVFPSYSPEAGVSEWGMGWQVALSITRTRLVGDLDYATDELSGPWGRLVLGTDGAWYAAGLSPRVRVQPGADTLVASLPDGTRLTFGGAARVTNAKGTYAWQLIDAVSVTGRKTHLTWAANASGRQYLQNVAWGGFGDDLQYRADFTYEALTLPFSDYRSGFPVLLDQRVKRVTVLAKNATTGAFDERWHADVAYQAEGFGPAFYLASVQQVFRSGASRPATRYAYNLASSRLATATLEPSNTPKFDPRNNVVTVLRQLGARALQPDKSATLDAELDGRPDLESQLDYTLARQTATGVTFEPLPASATASPLCRRAPSTSNPPRLLAQLRGDDTVNVVDVRTDASHATSTITACDRVGELMGSAVVSGDWVPSATVRLVDLNRDHKPDLVRVQAGLYRVLQNTSTATGLSFATAKVASLSPSVTPDTAWVADVNGDGLPDLVVRYASGLMLYNGKGNFEFAPGQLYFLKTQSGALFTQLSTYAFTFTDANKDGLIDLVLSRSGASYLLMNLGNCLQETPVPGLRSVVAGQDGPYAVDLAGTGDTQLVYRGSDPATGAPLAWGVVLDGPETSLLASADDGRGSSLAFAYARAPAEPAERQRHPVLSRLTATSSGNDAIASDYVYSGARVHSVGKFVLGFDQVTKVTPTLVETAGFLNEDRYSGLQLSTTTHDPKAPAADAFSSLSYEEAITAGVPFKRLTRQSKGLRDTGGQVLSETTDYLAYTNDYCPSSLRTTTAAGVLSTTRTYAAVPALAGAMACSLSGVIEQGAHADASLDFRHEVAITRNTVGLLTLLESVSPNGRWTVQEVGYNAESLPVSVGAPGHGTSSYAYETGTRLLRQVIAPDGVVSEVTGRDPVTDGLLTLRTTRGASSWQQFFSFDGLERLASRRDDLGAATAALPNERYVYQDATASAPGSIRVSALIDAVAGITSNRVELFTAAGEEAGSAVQVPEGWAFGRLVSRSRVRAETQGWLRATSGPATDPAVMDWNSLFAAATPVDFASTSTLAGTVDERATFHAGVERRLLTGQALEPGALVRTATENATLSTVTRVDASQRVVAFDDEAGVRTRFAFDALGRVRVVTLPDGQHHTLSYDGHGRASRVVREGVATVDLGYDPASGLLVSRWYSSPSGVLQRTEALTYDALGRLTQELHTDAQTGATKTFREYYDGATPTNPTATTSPGLLTAVTSDGYSRLLTYRVDGTLIGRSVSLAGWRTVVTALSYAESGAVKSRTVQVLDGAGNPVSRHDWLWGFDAWGRTAAVTLNGALAATFQYDANNLLTSAALTSGDQVTLSYDPVTRRSLGSSHALPFVGTSAGAATSVRLNPRGLLDQEDFTVAGQLLTRRYAYSPQRFLTGASDDSHQYGYGFDSSGLPLSIVENGVNTSLVRSGSTLTAGNTVYRFDELGRTAARGDLSMTYGPDGQLASATRGANQWTFAYDEGGHRLLKFAGGVPQVAYLDEGTLDASGLTEPLEIAGHLVALVHDGSVGPLVTDMRGTVMADGNAAPRIASPFGTRDLHPEHAAAVDYVKKGFDADLGLVRAGVRDFDPSINRFSTPDPLYLEHPEKCAQSPLDCNLYGYARNAPGLFADPSGTEPEFAMPDNFVDGTTGVQGIVRADGTSLKWRPPYEQPQFDIRVTAHPSTWGPMLQAGGMASPIADALASSWARGETQGGSRRLWISAVDPADMVDRILDALGPTGRIHTLTIEDHGAPQYQVVGNRGFGVNGSTVLSDLSYRFGAEGQVFLGGCQVGACTGASCQSVITHLFSAVSNRLGVRGGDALFGAVPVTGGIWYQLSGLPAIGPTYTCQGFNCTSSFASYLINGGKTR
jgi:RHS repeat-associated protein